MLGSPVRDQLAVSPSVLRTVRLVARLGDLGVRGLFSNELPATAPAARSSARSRSAARRRATEASRSTRAATRSSTGAPASTPHAECVEVDGSHCGMSVNRHVYRELDRLLERSEEIAWSG